MLFTVVRDLYAWTAATIRGVYDWFTTPPGLLTLAILLVLVLCAVTAVLVVDTRRGRAETLAARQAEQEDAARCCDAHEPQAPGEPPVYPAEWLGEGYVIAACCDPEDCGPCCENCPTCPTLRRINVPRAR